MRKDANNLSNYPIGMRDMEGFLEEAVYFIRRIAREEFEEICNEKQYSLIKENTLLTTQDLCKRWNIKPDTLLN